jgi:MFS family permease
MSDAKRPNAKAPNAKVQVILLALCQALAMTTNTILITTAALIGFALAEDKALATLPLAFRQGTTMVTTIPASLLMQRWGRQKGFLIGTLLGGAGAGLGLYSLTLESFWGFAGAMALLGTANGFVGYYRFAAAEVSDDGFRSQAISWVIAGGILAGILGPWIATGSQGWFNSELYIGAIAAVLGLQLLNMVLLLGLRVPEVVAAGVSDRGRSLGRIVAQPSFLVASLGSTISYSIMVFVMTATPLAMAAALHRFDQTAAVIQWHIFGMFGPSLFTGWFIQRWGVLTIIQAGAVMMLVSLGINLMGTSVAHFGMALLLLGLGWNFMYVGSTTLLTETYRPSEKGKVQALHDFIMFSFVALATYFSGRVFHRFDWTALNMVSWPLVLVTLGVVMALQYRRWRSRAV